MKKGLSFTLTLVVVGVILLMTALSVITLGGSSINAFFETISGEQDEAVRQNAIAEACREKMDRVDRNYCNYYVKTATYTEGGSTSNWFAAYSDYMNETDDTWTDSRDCGDYQRAQDPRGYSTANDGGSGGGSAYDRTASEVGCPFTEHTDYTPTVNVQGQTYDCIQEGVISDARCPAND